VNTLTNSQKKKKEKRKIKDSSVLVRCTIRCDAVSVTISCAGAPGLSSSGRPASAVPARIHEWL